MRKFFFVFLSLWLFAGCTADRWTGNISDNQITIVRMGEYLEISVFVPQKNLKEFDEFDSYIDLLHEAFAAYLKLSDDAKFECPGLETVSERSENSGRTTVFRIPANALKVLKQ